MAVMAPATRKNFLRCTALKSTACRRLFKCKQLSLAFDSPAVSAYAAIAAQHAMAGTTIATRFDPQACPTARAARAGRWPARLGYTCAPRRSVWTADISTPFLEMPWPVRPPAEPKRRAVSASILITLPATLRTVERRAGRFHPEWPPENHPAAVATNLAANRQIVQSTRRDLLRPAAAARNRYSRNACESLTPFARSAYALGVMPSRPLARS